MENKKEALRLYSSLGYHVLGLNPNSKTPMTSHGLYDASPKCTHLNNYPCNIAIRTGTCSGVVVLDVDSKGGGLESAQTLPLAGCETFTVATPSGGYHYYFKAPENPLKNRIGLYPGIDFKAENGYVVAPPSTINEVPYTVVKDTPVAPLPEWLEKKLQEREPSIIETVAEEGHIPEGQRTKYLVALGGALRRKGLSEAAILAALKETNYDKCEPALPDWEVGNIAKSVGKYPIEESFELEEVAEGEKETEIVKASDLLTETFEFLEDKDLVKGEPTGLEGLDLLLGGGKRLGELTAWHAEAKTGKNSLWHYMMVELLNKGLPLGYASRELSPQTDVLPNLLSVEHGKNVFLEDVEREAYEATVVEWGLYFAKGYGYFPLESMKSWVRGLKQLGVEYFFFDHVHYMLEDPEDHKAASKLVKELKTLSMQENIHIDLIIQPNKLMEGQKLSLNSIKGGSSMGQAIDNLVILNRVRGGQPNITRVALDVGRSKLCKPGHFFVEYDPSTMRFTEVEYKKEEPKPEAPTYSNTELKVL